MSLRRNALLLVLLTGLLGILGQWDPALARWWCLPAAVLLGGLACEVAVSRGCDVRLAFRGPEHWLLGRAHGMQLVFAQSARPHVTIQVALSAPESFSAEPRIETLRLARDRGTATVLRARARRLGEYRWPVPAMRVSGALGLAWWPKPLAAGCSVTVIPDLGTRPAIVAGHRAGGAQRAHPGAGGGTEILQLRDYRHGDPLRAIDWKASARRGMLISRERCEERHLELMIAIDSGQSSGLAAGEMDRLGAYVNVAARLAQRASELDDAVGVVVFASQPLAMLPPARGAAAVVRIRRMLSACRVQQGASNPTLAAARIRLAARRRTLVVLLTDLADAPEEQLVQAVRLLSPKHFTYIAGLENPQILALPLERSDDPLAPYRTLAATEYRQALSSRVRALRALGAAALTARPGHLDRAVLEAYRETRLRRRV